MNLKIYNLVLLSALFVGCSTTTNNVKPLRYNGVYKTFSHSHVIYSKFQKDSDEWNFVNYKNEDDKRAIKALSHLEKTDSKNKKTYKNEKDFIEVSGENQNGSWTKSIEKNANGEIKNSFFIQTENELPQKTIDLREKHNYKLYSFYAEPLTDDTYKEAKSIGKKYAYVTNADGSGVLDIYYKNFIIPAKYQWVGDIGFKNRITAYKEDGKYGFLHEGEKMIKAKYHEVQKDPQKGYFVDDAQPVKMDKKWYFIDKKGKKIGKKSFDNVNPYTTQSFIPIYDANQSLYSFYDLRMANFTDFRAYKYHIENGYNILEIGNGKKVILDRYGNKFLNFIFDDIVSYKSANGDIYFVAAVPSGEKKSLKMVFDRDAQILLAPNFEDIKPLYDNRKNILYFIASKDTYHEALYDTAGKLVLPAKYYDIKPFGKKYLLVASKKGTKSKFSIIKKGEKKPLFSADFIQSVDERYALFAKNNKKGIIDNKLKVHEQPIDNIQDAKNGVYVVKNGENSAIYKIGQKNKIFQTKGSIILTKRYIIVKSKEENSIYNYNLKKLNEDSIISISQCKDKNVILINDGKYALVKYDEFKYLPSDVQSASCKDNYFVTATVKEGSMFSFMDGFWDWLF